MRRSTSTAAVSPTFRKTIGQSSSLSRHTTAGDFLPKQEILCLSAVCGKRAASSTCIRRWSCPVTSTSLLSPLRDGDGRKLQPAPNHACDQGCLGRSGPVWQAKFFDHVLRSNDGLAEKGDYICQNPVRAGLVAAEGEYRWLWRGAIPIL